MSQKRKRLSGPGKLTIVRRYLIDRVPISELCDEHGLQPSQIYRWQAAITGRLCAPTDIAATFYFLSSVLDRYSRAIVHWEIRETMKEPDLPPLNGTTS